MNWTEIARNYRKQHHCLEWRNNKTIMSQAADEIFTHTEKKNKICEDKIELDV